MTLVKINEILEKARKEKYAVPAFDVSDYRMARCVIDACEEMNSPVILMGLPGDLKEDEFDYLSMVLVKMSKKATIPVCIHLDHATEIDIIKKAIDEGYTSVMIDASSLPLKENIKLTKEVVDYAHKFNVSVEAELGHVGDGIVGNSEASAKGESGHDNVLTDKDEMKEFINATNVDCLAVSFGTSHGVYKHEPKLELELLKELNEASNVPLVVHGGSGTPDDQMKEAIKLGITKVNIFSDLLEAFFSEMKDFLNEQNNLSLWPSVVYEKPLLKMKEVVKEKIELCGSKGKA